MKIKDIMKQIKIELTLYQKLLEVKRKMIIKQIKKK